MRDDQMDQFAIVISALFESFGTEVTKPRVFGYWLGLRDLELNAIENAVARAIVETDRLPLPVTLRRLCGELSPAERSAIAWDDVLKAIDYGPYKHVDFEDKAINATIRNMGGWPNFTSRFTDAESEKWTRIEFLKCYEVFARRTIGQELAAPLAGLSTGELVNGVVDKPQVRLIACASCKVTANRIGVSNG